MREYTDALKRNWRLSINVATVRRIMQVSNIDVLALATGTLADDLIKDPCRAADLLWPMVMDQAAAAGITLESFCEGLSGDALERAIEILLDEVIDFFPSAPYRAELRARYDAALRVIRRTSSQRMSALADPATTEALEREAETALAAQAATPKRSSKSATS